jgi:hypothetical protein
MIARLWRTGIDPALGTEYDALAATYSRPMFGALAGCLGAFFLGTGEVRSVLSLWVESASIDALESSPLSTARRWLAFRPPGCCASRRRSTSLRSAAVR